MADKIAKLEVVDKGRKLRLADENIKSPRKALSAIGASMSRKAQDAFINQKRGAENWPPRGVPNVIGIVKDLEAGRNIPARRFEPRKAGFDTGRLANSITFRILGQVELEIGTNVEYARDFQEGGPSVVQLTQTIKEGLNDFLATNREWEDDLGSLRRMDEIEVNVPPRPFLVITKEDRQEINEIIKLMVTEPTKPPRKKTKVMKGLDGITECSRFDDCSGPDCDWSY